VLLHALPGQQTELYEKVRAYEGTRLYVEGKLPVRTADGSIVQARAFVGNQPDRGNAEAMVHGEWSSRTDPLFEYGMNAVTRLARELLTPVNGVPAVPSGPVESDDFWERFVPLEGLFLVLCSVLERYMHLVYGASVKPTKRIEKLWEDTDAVAAVKDAAPPPLDVIDNRDPVPAASGAPSSPFQKWYTVRSNLTHRGKGARHDFQLLARAVVGLHDTLRYLLARKLTPGRPDQFASEDKLLRGIVVD
jgi:hypothetical protein